MLSVFNNIRGVARYERKMLLRTTKFRILGGLGMSVPVLLGIGLAIAEANGFEPPYVGMDSYIPFYVYSFLQAVVIAFIVGDFRAADEQANIYEVVAGRPISTAELVAGKYLGIAGALFFLSLGVLILTLAIQAAKISITGNPFNIEPYVVYLLLMNLPALIFMSSLTFFLGAVLRRQTAVALVIIGYLMAVLMYLGRRYDGIFDFGAFYAPLYYSDLIGLGNFAEVGLQRLFYILLGVGFFGFSIDRYPRLAHSMLARWFGRSCALTGFGLAAMLYFYMDEATQTAKAYRRSVLRAQEAVAHISTPQVSHYDFKFAVLDDAPFSGVGKITLKNPHDAPLDTLVLSLNTGLKITSLTLGDGRDVDWQRKKSVISVTPKTPVQPDESLDLAIAYSGDINTDSFDLKRGRAKLRKKDGPFNKGSITAWIRDKSVFLPPRSRWYPTAGVDYGHEDAVPVSFSTADLHMTFPKGLEAITQGQIVSTDTLGESITRTWKVENPVPQFSLNAGVYEVYSAKIHNIDCAFYVHPSHLRPVKFFEGAEEEVVNVLGQMMDSMEQESAMQYPYPRLSVVEIPFHIQWYYEGWEEKGGLTQPGVLMIEEDVLMKQRLTRDYRQQEQRTRGNREPKDIKKDLLVRSIFSIFFASEQNSSRNPGGLFRSPVVQLWTFNKQFVGDHHSLLKKGMPMYLQTDLSSSMSSAFYSSRRGSGRTRGGRGGFTGGRGGVRTSSAGWDTLIAKMQDQSFADLDPDKQAGLYRQVLDAKGPALFRLMESVMGEETFRTVVDEIDQNHKYENIDFSSFERAAVGDTTANENNQRLQRLVKDWIYGTEIPGYTLTRVKAEKMDDGFGMVVFQLTLRIKNSEPGRGYVQITATGRGDEATKGVEIEGGQEVEVAMVLWEQPFRVQVEPFFARNRRTLMSPVRIPEKVTEGFPISYVKDVTGEDDGIIELIVDNDDEGFTMPVRRVTRYFRPELKGGNWREQTMPMAFGRFETNFRHKNPGDGAQPAIWETKIPKDGEYDVAFYFPDPSMARRFRIGSEFTLMITHGSQVDTLKMQRDQMKNGWNYLGRFKYQQGEDTRIEMPDISDGRLYADAVRWRYFDPQNPDAYADYDMPVFNFGRGRGGPGGGRGGGRGDGGRERGRSVGGRVGF